MATEEHLSTSGQIIACCAKLHDRQRLRNVNQPVLRRQFQDRIERKRMSRRLGRRDIRDSGNER